MHILVCVLLWHLGNKNKTLLVACYRARKYFIYIVMNTKRWSLGTTDPHGDLDAHVRVRKQALRNAREKLRHYRPL